VGQQLQRLGLLDKIGGPGHTAGATAQQVGQRSGLATQQLA
jgi:hypothetical protein